MVLHKFMNKDIMIESDCQITVTLCLDRVKTGGKENEREKMGEKMMFSLVWIVEESEGQRK